MLQLAQLAQLGQLDTPLSLSLSFKLIDTVSLVRIVVYPNYPNCANYATVSTVRRVVHPNYPNCANYATVSTVSTVRTVRHPPLSLFQINRYS